MVQYPLHALPVTEVTGQKIHSQQCTYIKSNDILNKNTPFITSKMEHISFKSGCFVRVENAKMCHQLWQLKTKVRL